MIVNGERRELPEGRTVTQVLGLLGIERARVAVERNRIIVKRADHDTTVVEDGDVLEIIHFVGGG